MAASDDGRYPGIGDYGLVGDLRSAALISRQGSVDWMCLPRFDSPWVFGRLLDWQRGGFFQLAPAAEATAFRQYRTDSNVLETTWTQERCRMRVVDFMPVVANAHGQPPESVRLVRIVQPVSGALEWKLTFAPRFDYGRHVPVLKRLRPGMLEAAAGRSRLALQYPDDVVPAMSDGTATIAGRSLPGRPRAFILHYLEGEPGPALVPFADARTWLERTGTFWSNWFGSCRYRGRFEEHVRRSALTLKLMQYLPTGAFVAAPTTSLPESLGGTLNWDYRYTWLRDGAVLVNALLDLGFEEEAAGFMRWLGLVHQRHPEQFQIMYQVDGEERIPEYTLEDLEGYRGSRPVRIGNAAVDQVQLDVYGEIMETAHAAWRARKSLPRLRRQTLIAIVDYVLAHWQDEDSGIWEARQRKRRYLYSQVMCWTALDRALRMDPALRMGARRRAAVLRTRAEIKRTVLTRGFNREVGAFTQALDATELDATALTVPLVGMIPATDARVASTVAVLQQRLTRDGFLYRYLPQDSEFQQPEGVFIICTFWLVMVLAQMGRQQEAEELFSRATEAANDLGLLAEEFEPATRLMLGNFPQALTHLSLIGAVLNLEGRATGRGVERRAGR